MDEKARRKAARKVFQLDGRVKLLPVIHGSADCAIRVREELLARSWDCLALPLPPSFQPKVEEAVGRLPVVSVVVAEESRGPAFLHEEVGDFQLDPGGDAASGGDLGGRFGEDGPEEVYTYVPVEPCQPVIAALRVALQERLPRAYVDAETTCFESTPWNYPDPYALKTLPYARFAAAMLPAAPPPASRWQAERIVWMAARLRELAQRHEAVLALCSFLEWPWLREAYRERLPAPDPVKVYSPPAIHPVRESTLAFFLGELPYTTYLHERARRELRPDEELAIDAVKALLLEARDRYVRDHAEGVRLVSPQTLSRLLQYVRNLTLLERRLTPSLYTLVLAAKQVAGDGFAIQVLETSREYPYQGERDPETEAAFGPERAELPGAGVVTMKNRLPGASRTWRPLELKPPPRKGEAERWRHRWNPRGDCSWPPEDERVESFQTHVREQAKALLCADLARSEKFSTSILDGIDIRETIRHWYSGDIYVKRYPPARTNIEVVTFLFDVPADPEAYPWRAVWYAEHEEESTLAFYATAKGAEMVGPGIAQCQYGGAFFLFPPRGIPDIWIDPRLYEFATLEERLIAGACLHSKDPAVALVAPCPPKAAWRRIASRFGRRLIPIPLSRFNPLTIERVRAFHVLNGKQVRSYAADFIRHLR